MDTSTSYFISDLHLEASRKDLAEAFRIFLRDIASNAHALYILGDLFDQWVGDDNNAPFVSQVRSWLADFAARGPALYFQHGNRDFLIGEQFARQSGATLLNEHSLIELNGESVLLLHGDTLCTRDDAYQAFRKKVRHPNWKKKVLGKPLFARKLLAAYIRFRSRRANNNKAENIMDVTPAEVQKLFNEYGVKKIIHGHTHRPARHHTTNAAGDEVERIVLGDWDKNAWYLKVTDNDFELVDIPIVSLIGGGNA